ncbi:MAG: hypothetical protein RBS88_09555 [Spongiibacteraceae bacterium]|jgi:hypothetical protein|nr:hypothetical protein [Spongiibacteraceae bacterium]
MESVLGRVIAAAIGIAVVFALTFASNSVEHATARDAALAEQLSPEELVSAYLAAEADAATQAQYLDANAVVHPARVVACGETDPLVLTGAAIVVHRAGASDTGGAVDVLRVVNGKIVEHWQSRAAIDCEGGQS